MKKPTIGIFVLFVCMAIFSGNVMAASDTKDTKNRQEYRQDRRQDRRELHRELAKDAQRYKPIQTCETP